jgi:Spy/CpxP family protein refolding chaperone
MLRVLAFVLAAALIVPAGAADASGWPGGGLGKHHGKFWKRAKVREKVQLTDDEVARLEEIFARHRPALEDLESNVKKKKADLDALLADDHADDARIMAGLEALEHARGDLGKARVTMLLEMRRVLTPVQRERLAALDEDDDD